VASTYCYLLRLQDHRDADTWGVRLLELVDRGFRPQATIADFARDVRAAQAEVLPRGPLPERRLRRAPRRRAAGDLPGKPGL
jgi:hypothetical protein